MAVALAVLGALAALATLLGLTNPRRPSALVPVTFFPAWLSQDLAPFHLGLQIVVTAILVAFGALGSAAGWVGVVLMVLSWIGLVVLWRQQRQAAPVLDAALREAIGAEAAGPSVAADPVPLRALLRPFHGDVRGVDRVRNLAYGEHPREVLDVVKPAGGRTGCPVLLQVHGGAWIIGKKDQQGQPLMRVLAQRGWVCVAINYRLSPKATFPDHLIDVKLAIAWIRRNIHEHGGDPSRLVITGGSAGGHLAALAALTPNDPRYQPGFEDVDTTVQGCVPFYGVYDFLDRDGIRAGQLEGMLEKYVMKCPSGTERSRWEDASPRSQINPHAPPFLVIQGAQDTLVYREEARAFVADLRAVSPDVVGYAEVPHAQHAFDLMVNRRTVHTVRAVTRFLDWLEQRR